MTPRKYDLGRRGEAMLDTRRRIIEATMALHAEQGILATSHRDVARRADVGVGTVYHHFPTIEELVTACGSRVMEVIPPPTAEAFDGLRSRKERVSRMVSELFGWYERYPFWRRAVCDADKLEALARGVERRNAALREFIAAGLGLDADAGPVITARALLDFEVYRSLIDSGRSTDEAAEAVTKVLLSGL